MPECVTVTISKMAFSPPPSAALRSPLSREAKGSLSFHSGCSGASALTRSSAKASWKYIGCSAHSVPSLSKVAILSADGTRSGEPCLVTRSTNVTIAFLVTASFHDGNGSVTAVCAIAGVWSNIGNAVKAAKADSIARRLTSKSLSFDPMVSSSVFSVPVSDHTPKPEMAGGCIDRLGVARGGTVAPAVVRRTEMRAALDHLAGDLDIGLGGI